MVGTAYFVKFIPLRASIGSFQYFADIYFSNSVCISVFGGVSSKKFHFSVPVGLEVCYTG